MFVNYKLKLKEAKEQGLDSKPSYVRELDNYKKQLAKNYLTDSEVTEELVAEAYDNNETGDFPFLIEQLYRFGSLSGLDVDDPLLVIDNYNKGLRYPNLSYQELAFIERLKKIYPEGMKWKK